MAKKTRTKGTKTPYRIPPYDRISWGLIAAGTLLMLAAFPLMLMGDITWSVLLSVVGLFVLIPWGVLRVPENAEEGGNSGNQA